MSSPAAMETWSVTRRLGLRPWVQVRWGGARAWHFFKVGAWRLGFEHAGNLLQCRGAQLPRQMGAYKAVGMIWSACLSPWPLLSLGEC